MALKEFYFNNPDDLKIVHEPAIYHIGIGKLVLSVYFKPVFSSDSFYVFSPGYLDRKNFKHPYFQRLKWFDEIECSGLIITDPTLGKYDNIGISWFQGDKDRFAIFDISIVVEKFRLFLGLRNSKLLFFGSSAGGFASLMLSTIAKGSCCLVNNPQTNVFRFREPFITNMLRVCYPGMSLESVRQKYMTRMSVAKFMEANQSIPKCIYLQNIADREHYEGHMLPFLKSIGKAAANNNSLELDNITIRVYKDEQAGHNPAVLHFLKPYFEMANRDFLC